MQNKMPSPERVTAFLLVLGGAFLPEHYEMVKEGGLEIAK